MTDRRNLIEVGGGGPDDRTDRSARWRLQDPGPLVSNPRLNLRSLAAVGVANEPLPLGCSLSLLIALGDAEEISARANVVLSGPPGDDGATAVAIRFTELAAADLQRLLHFAEDAAPSGSSLSL